MWLCIWIPIQDFLNRFLQPNLVQLHQQKPSAKQYTCVVSQGVEHDMFCPCFLKFLCIWQLPEFLSNVKLMTEASPMKPATPRPYTKQPWKHRVGSWRKRHFGWCNGCVGCVFVGDELFCAIFGVSLLWFLGGCWCLIFVFCSFGVDDSKSFFRKDCLCRSFWDL